MSLNIATVWIKYYHTNRPYIQGESESGYRATTCRAMFRYEYTWWL